MTKLDKRYSIGLEWCGQPTQMFIARFCGDWLGKAYSAEAAEKIASAHHKRLQPAKRYQVYQLRHQLSDATAVRDTWTNRQCGVYPTKKQAQARARVLNSRQGA